jgi:carbonic anhydrase
MSVAGALAERNADFAAHRFPGAMKLMPKLRTIVIGCVDPRVAPEDVLGLELGEAAELRNVGAASRPGCWPSWRCCAR